MAWRGACDESLIKIQGCEQSCATLDVMPYCMVVYRPVLSCTMAASKGISWGMLHDATSSMHSCRATLELRVRLAWETGRKPMYFCLRSSLHPFPICVSVFTCNRSYARAQYLQLRRWCWPACIDILVVVFAEGCLTAVRTGMPGGVADSH